MTIFAKYQHQKTQTPPEHHQTKEGVDFLTAIHHDQPLTTISSILHLHNHKISYIPRQTVYRCDRFNVSMASPHRLPPRFYVYNPMFG
jgi:hypothetical protein